MMKRFTVSVVVPVYNSEGCLEDLVTRLGEVLPQVASDYEVVLIDDASSDRSWEVERFEFEPELAFLVGK